MRNTFNPNGGYMKKVNEDMVGTHVPHGRGVNGKSYLCLILDLKGKQLDEFQINSYNEYVAKMEAKALFEIAMHYTPSKRKHGTYNINWTVDVVQL